MLGMLLIPQSVLALEAFDISSYNVNMDVGLNNSYKITETIDVSFSEQRRGIIRSIPLTTNGGYRAKVSDVMVENHNAEVYSEDGYQKIKIGDADKFAPQKTQYVISYVYTIGYDYMDNMDELYFNIIGPQWDCNISNVSFKVNMPKTFDKDKLNFTYGATGSTENTNLEHTVNGNTISGKLNQKLGSYEALTIALPLEEGYFSEAKKEANFADFISKFYFLILPAILVLMMLLWSKKGKSSHIIPTVEFYPPEGLTSADVGFMIDNEVNPMDITSLIIYWVTKTVTTNLNKPIQMYSSIDF